MIAKRTLNIVIVGMLIIAACEANYYSDYLKSYYNDYSKKLSSYIRTVGQFVDADTSHKVKLQQKNSPVHVNNAYYEQTSDGDRNGDTESCYTELRKCWSMKNTDISDDIMSRRIVNMLLSRSKVRAEGSIIRRYIIMETSDSELHALTQFGRGELKIREIDPILNNAIKNAESYDYIDYALMIYTSIATLVNYLVDQKKNIISFIILTEMVKTFTAIRWNFWNILYASIHNLLSTCFLISWWKLLQDDQIKGRTSQDFNVPIQCQPDKMRWMDKAMTWFHDYDCDKHYENKLQYSLHEDTPDDAFVDELMQTIIEMLILSSQFFRAIPHFVTNGLLQMLPAVIFSFIIVFGTHCGYIFLKSLDGFIRKCGKLYSTIENNILKVLRYVQSWLSMTKTARAKKFDFPPGRTNIESIHRVRPAEKKYYRISCTMDTSLIIKINAGAKGFDKSELETKIHSIVRKRMAVERILGRIVMGEKEQITVAMKRKEDKEELIERWREMRENGLFVKEDVILLDEIARWNILGFSNDESLKQQVREIRINGEAWIWVNETREWVQKKVIPESLNINDNNEQAKV